MRNLTSDEAQEIILNNEDYEEVKVDGKTKGDYLFLMDLALVNSTNLGRFFQDILNYLPTDSYFNILYDSRD